MAALNVFLSFISDVDSMTGIFDYFICDRGFIDLITTGKVGDLIDQHTNTWKIDLIRSLYPFPQASTILQIPISKTGSVQDKILWKYSKNGDYQVKKAYEFLVKDHSTLARKAQTQERVWNLIWRVKVLLKINNFMWKLMHDSLPTLLSLKNRGISTPSTCTLCNEDDESTTHLFLLCPFTRACWHGSTLAIHYSDFSNIFVQHWLTLLLFKYKVRGIDSIVSCRPSSQLYGPFGTIETG